MPDEPEMGTTEEVEAVVDFEPGAETPEEQFAEMIGEPEAAVREDEAAMEFIREAEESLGIEPEEKNDETTPGDEPDAVGEAGDETIPPATGFNEDLKYRAGIAGVDDQVMAAFEAAGDESRFREYLGRLEQAPVEETAEDAPVIPELDISLDPDEYDEKIIGAFDGVKEQFNALRKVAMDIHEREGVLLSTIEQLQQRDDAARFDATVASTGDKFATVLGKGTTAALKSAAHRDNRQAVREQMDVLRTAYQAKGKTLTDAQLLEKAVVMEFSDQIKATAREEINGKLKDRGKRMTARPTKNRRTKSTASPREEAIAAGYEILRDRGLEDPHESAQEAINRLSGALGSP